MQARGAHQLGRRRVLGDLGRERPDAAAGVEERLLPEHALALREAEAEGLADILPARLEGVEEGAFHLGPEAVRARSGRGRADETGVGPPGGQEPLEVVRRHQHVGIGEHDPVVARRLPASHAVVELRVAAHLHVADDELRRDLRVRRPQPLDQGHDGIVAAGDAEDQLVARVVEPETRGERLLAERLEAADRPDEGDGRPVGGSRKQRRGPDAGGPSRRRGSRRLTRIRRTQTAAAPSPTQEASVMTGAPLPRGPRRRSAMRRSVRAGHDDNPPSSDGRSSGLKP